MDATDLPEYHAVPEGDNFRHEAEPGCECRPSPEDHAVPGFGSVVVYRHRLVNPVVNIPDHVPEGWQ